MRRQLLPAVGGLVVSASWLGCQDPLGDLRSEEASRASVRLTHHDGLEAVPQVLRLHVELDDPSVVPADLELFQGELSSYYRTRVAQRELVEALLERRIPMLVWQTIPGEFFAQPSEVLDAQATYTLAAVGHGVLAQFNVGQSETPLLRRRWPTALHPGGAFGGLYCLDRPAPLGAADFVWDPPGAPGKFSPFPLLPDCAVLSTSDPLDVAVPEPLVGGVLIDPAPLVRSNAPAPVPRACSADCLAAGPGCLCPQDDRAEVVGPEAAVLWTGQMGADAVVQETHGGSRFVVPGLSPETSQVFGGAWFDRDGRWTPFEVHFRTLQARARVCINEVYADPQGSEPAQEWVELVNGGTLTTNLVDYVLEDAGGATVLPNVELPPGAFAVVVNASYQPDPDFDPVPHPAAAIVRVERLGKSGLANAGELLRLRTPDGLVVSLVPARPAPEPGVSVARRHPWSLDDAADAFALHGPPGASPGTPNQFAPGMAD